MGQELAVFLKKLSVDSIGQAQDCTSDDAILANALSIGSAPWSTFRYGPAPDGAYVPIHPSIALRDGNFSRNGLEIMTGHNSFESPFFTPPFVRSDKDLAGFLSGLFPDARESDIGNILQLYPKPGINRTIDLLSDVAFACNNHYITKAFRGRTYNFKFLVPPSVHGSELAYIYYNGPDAVPGGIYVGDRGPVLVDAAVVMQRYVVNFVRGGDPNGPRGPPFPRADEGGTMLAVGAEGVQVAPDDTNNPRCEWFQGMPYG